MAGDGQGRAGAGVKPSTRIHYDYARYVITHGTPTERKNLNQTLLTMGELVQAFPGSEWEPMTEVILIDSLMELAERVAQRRISIAEKQHYRDHQGKVGRSFAEERVTVRGHIAAKIMLGLPLNKPSTKEEARIVGNIGNGNEAFVPIHNPLNHNLIVDPKTPDAIVSWLVVPEGERQFKLAGWIEAKEAKQDMYRHERVREGGTSVAYWVPPEMLHDPKEWWER